MPQVGEQAPDFSAPLDDGGTFTLSDWRGHKRVVLYFYPKDFTFGCSREACAFRDSIAMIEAHDAVVVGVSADDMETHRRFRQSLDLPFPLLADTERRIIDLYQAGPPLPFFPFPRSRRATYLIDRSGVIRGIYRHEFAFAKHRDDILHGLEALARD